MSIAISLVDQPWNDVFRRLLYGSGDQKGIPLGRFYDNRAIVTPFSRGKTVFRLDISSDLVNSPFKVSVIKENDTPGIDAVKTANVINIIPQNETSAFAINLGKGLNHVVVQSIVPGTEEHPVTFNVLATYFGTLLDSYAKEVYNNIDSILEETREAIFAENATRLVEPILSYLPILSDIKSIQAFQLETSIRALVNNPGSENSVVEFIKAIIQSTPLIKKIEDGFNFNPEKFNIHSTQENFGGSNVHIWLNHVQVERWAAFARLVDSFGKNVKRITKNEIVYDDNGELRTHRFTFEQDGGNTGRLENFGEPQAWVSRATSRITFSVDAFVQPFPIPVTVQTPLSDNGTPLYLDQGNAFDSGRSIDAGNYFDPFDDGLVGIAIVPYLRNPQTSVPGTNTFYKTSAIEACELASTGIFTGTITVTP